MKNGSNSNKLPYHKTKVTRTNTITTINYNGTTVVTIAPQMIVLDTGGWRSRTCKRRMNQASNQFNLGFKVYQHQNKWWVEQETKNSLKVQEFVGETLRLNREF